MGIKAHRILIVTLLLIAGLTAKAQLYSNDFENRYTWYPPWANIVIAVDSSGTENNYVCLCDSTREYGLGMSIEAGKLYPEQNLNLKYRLLFKSQNKPTHAEIVFSIDNETGNKYWQSYPLASFVNDTAAWSQINLDLNFPSDYLCQSIIKTFIWNRKHEILWFDNAEIKVTPWTMPSFLPEIQPDSITEDSFVLRMDDSLQTPLTYPIGIFTEFILDGDTVSEYQRFKKAKHGTFDYLAVSAIDSTYASWVTVFQEPFIGATSSFFKEAKLLRKALVVPFIDSTLTVYRRNMKTENGVWRTENGGLSQKAYYLDREGFQVGKGERSIVSYHQIDISSTQFDAANRVAFFNLDYWRDHPMIHYPLSDTLDHFEDVSYRPIHDGMKWHHFVMLHIGNDMPNLPRIMSIPYGYESGIIFTEHADWTDIRTHRAVLFGSEKITKAKDATGGFVYYGIPVTKSVFYNNPDGITNEKISHGTFKGLHSTIKTDREFEKLLKQLHKTGFDICLHTPEQYTTTPGNLRIALNYMQRKFKSTTWIDHGYNNDVIHNREDMVCDGLNRKSQFYAADLWQSHGVKYLWNAYYEENSMMPWHFDNNLIQPYPGFGDALPNRQITLLTENGELKTENSPFSVFSSPFYTWCTPSTLEAVTDADWDFYYSDKRLQRIVDNHDVHITHAYPAWVWPGRTFWTYDADSTIVALPGMNRAFERIARLRDEHKMLPMTVKTYLDYYSGLLHVYYEIVDAEHIRLENLGEEVKGFTLLCPSPIRFEDNRYYEFRKSGDDYYIWFDLKAKDTIIIEIKDSVF